MPEFRSIGYIHLPPRPREGGMSSSEQPDITDMLLAWSQGDEASLQRLLPLVYEDLRRMPRRYMNGERSGHTLQTTALVHEAYERLVDTPRVHWRDRAHFLAVCAQLMRRVLVRSEERRVGKEG